MAGLRLRSYEFRREREGAWRELAALTERAEKRGLGSLSGDELLRLPQLYRGALSALSVARAISLDKALLDYLESLCQRAYVQVYGTRRPLRESLSDFFGRRFPSAVRALRWHLLLATLLLALGAVAGHALTASDAERYYSFVDPAMAGGRDPAASTDTLRDSLYDGGDHDGGDLGAFAAFLFTHNARVGMLCFALGFLAGVPVVLLLLTNGLLLGAFSALYCGRGLGWDFYGWVLPHGVTELLAVVLCGAAGFRVAHRLVFPGAHGRLASLARAGREAGVVVLGAIAMLVLAGLIEGIFRQTVRDISVRYAVIVLTTAGWAAYFLAVGRGRPAP